MCWLSLEHDGVCDIVFYEQPFHASLPQTDEAVEAMLARVFYVGQAAGGSSSRSSLQNTQAGEVSSYVRRAQDEGNVKAACSQVLSFFHALPIMQPIVLTELQTTTTHTTAYLKQIEPYIPAITSALLHVCPWAVHMCKGWKMTVEATVRKVLIAFNVNSHQVTLKDGSGEMHTRAVWKLS